MTYTVHYLIDDDEVCWSPPILSSEKARSIARAGIIRHSAHRARILNAAGHEVEMVSPET